MVLENPKNCLEKGGGVIEKRRGCDKVKDAQNNGKRKPVSLAQISRESKKQRKNL